MFMGPQPASPGPLPPRWALVGLRAGYLQGEGENCVLAVSMAIGAGRTSALGSLGSQEETDWERGVLSSREVAPQWSGPWAALRRGLGGSDGARLPREGTPAPHSSPASPAALNPATVLICLQRTTHPLEPVSPFAQWGGSSLPPRAPSLSQTQGLPPCRCPGAKTPFLQEWPVRKPSAPTERAGNDTHLCPPGCGEPEVISVKAQDTKK